MRRLFLSAALAVLGVAGVAQAHPKLVSASPAANAVVASPARVALRFSEKLVPSFSGATLTMTAHGGSAHSPITIAAASGVADGGRTLLITPKAPLVPGRYRLAWHVVAADTHRIAGSLAFAVR